MTGINDTGGKFASGINDTGSKFLPQFLLALLILVANLPTMSTIPAANLPPVSTTTVANCHTVRTVAADLRRGEHIPKMQNNIGRKRTLRVLRQQRSKDGERGGCWMPYRAGLGPALGLHNCRRFTLDRIRLWQRQKHRDGLKPCPSGL
jgi:hypothetical protein